MQRLQPVLKVLDGATEDIALQPRVLCHRDMGLGRQKRVEERIGHVWTGEGSGRWRVPRPQLQRDSQTWKRYAHAQAGRRPLTHGANEALTSK